MRPAIDAPRRCLRREQAAMYVGISPSKFSELVAEGRMPAPFQLDGCVLWDVIDLDAAIDTFKNPIPARRHRRAELEI